MDLICLILFIIDLYKPSIGLSVAVIATGLLDIIALECQHKKFNDAYVAYLVSIVGISIGTYTICVL